MSSTLNHRGLFNSGVAKKLVRGPALRTTNEWKKRLRQKLGEPGWSQQRLADAVGVARSTISVALLPATTRSRAVPLVCDHFGWPYPEIEIASSELAEAMALLEQLDDEGLAALIALLRNLVK